MTPIDHFYKSTIISLNPVSSPVSLTLNIQRTLYWYNNSILMTWFVMHIWLVFKRQWQERFQKSHTNIGIDNFSANFCQSHMWIQACKITVVTASLVSLFSSMMRKGDSAFPWILEPLLNMHTTFYMSVIMYLDMLPTHVVFEPTCAHARWALMRRVLSVRLSVCASWLEQKSLENQWMANLYWGFLRFNILY